MNKLHLTAFLATGFLILANADLQAQTRPNGNLYRSNLVRPAPQPLPVLRTTSAYNNFYPNLGATYSYNSYVSPNRGYVTPYNTYVNPYNTYVSPYNTYVNPIYYSSGYYPGVYPRYYQYTYPSYYAPTYPSYYSPNSYYGVFPGY